MARSVLKNVSAIPRDLRGGQVLAPGERTPKTVEITAHEEGLIAAGHLLRITSSRRTKSR